MSTTQDNRLLQIATPLGKDFLLLDRFSAKEALSELFEFEVELLHWEEDPGFKSTPVDVTQILGKQVTIKITHRDMVTREYSGIVNRFSKGDRSTRFSKYHATIVPHIWLLTQKFQSRIFQQKSVPDILREIFDGFEVKYELTKTYKPRNYCTQYAETDYDFACRMMEEEGIYFYFIHEEGTHRLLVADSPSSHKKLPSKDSISYGIKTQTDEDFISTITGLWEETQLQTGKVTFWDQNFQLPHKNLSTSRTSRFSTGDNQKLERYVYPGGYARKYDGISKSGGETGDLANVTDDKERTADSAWNALDAEYRTLTAGSDCCSLVAGHKFTLTNHPHDDISGDYLVTSIFHEAEQNPTYVTDDDVEEPYANRFRFIPAGQNSVPFVPERKTPKPFIRGSQTARVVGPAGEEIFTDKFGRVKVQFNWDRDGQENSDSSCWLRVTQMWAGNKWGSMFIPRIGMEVVVSFLEGDPDQPVITGCVYNPETMPPYTLPDEKTKSGIKTDSTKGGGGFNELRFEDKKGDEQIFVHAQKNLDIRVENDEMELVEKNRHLIVNENQKEKVKIDKHLEVGGNQNEKVTGSYSGDVKQNIDIKAGQNYAAESGMQMHLKSGMSLTIETGTNLTLKVGGNFININPGGVFIKGTMVMINSGGAAGTGPGAKPDPPQEPKEADKAVKGEQIKKKTSESPPEKPSITGLVANAFTEASRDGTPFIPGGSQPPQAVEPPPAPAPAPAPAPVVVAPVEKKPEQKTKKHWVEIILVDMEGKPVPNVKYKITPPGGGAPKEGVTDQHGQGGYWNWDNSGEWKISFPELDQDAWD